MNLPTFINKWILSNRFLRYHPTWWWVRLMNHKGFRFDDYHIWGSFWSSLNGGWLDMNYKWEFEKYFGENAKPETIVLPAKDFDALLKKINEPPDPEAQKRFRDILNHRAPWDDDT